MVPENFVVDVHNIVEEPVPAAAEARAMPLSLLLQLMEKAEVKAEASSNYDLSVVDRRLTLVKSQLMEISLGLRPATETQKIEEEIEYLTRLRERDFGN